MSKSGGVRLGKTRIPPMPVPGELFELYQPAIGQTATLLWLNLRWAAHSGDSFDIGDWAGKLDIAPREAQAAKEALFSYGLAEEGAGGELLVHDPLPREAFEARYGAAASLRAPSERRGPAAVVKAPFGAEAQAAGAAVEAARTDDSSEAAVTAVPAAARKSARSEEQKAGAAQPVMRSPLSKRRRNAQMLKLVEEKPEHEMPLSEDMQAVVQIYHKRIGMMGPTQYEKLRFWVEEKGMEGAVVALAIEETVQSADVPRIQYLEGILRNWFNDGIRTLADIQRQRRASKVLAKVEANGAPQGAANAEAYQTVNPEWVAKWKELYPDEYDA